MKPESMWLIHVTTNSVLNIIHRVQALNIIVAFSLALIEVAVIIYLKPKLRIPSMKRLVLQLF